MPSRHTLLPTSIVTFNTGTAGTSGQPKDEIFLMYSRGFEEGRARGLQRDGIGSPWMWASDLGRRITDPQEQRRGAWLIDKGVALEIEKDAIGRKRGNLTVRNRIDQELHRDHNEVLDEWLVELDDTPDYAEEFGKCYGPLGYRLAGMQGCGNLTMNNWFMGFVNSPFTDNQPVFLYRQDEQFQRRVYSCLVKSKGDSAVKIAKLKFNNYTRQVIEESSNKDITDDTEFAVFGQQLVEDGQIVDFRNIVTQFEDIRHLFKLPNINPSESLPGARQAERPRMLFGDDRHDDVWFGERELTQPETVDLLMHALSEPILLNRQFESMGATVDLIEAAFHASTGGGYRRLEGAEESFPPRERGTWRHYSENSIQIYLQRNVYAYTMIGVDDNQNIIASAAAGLAGRIGHNLEGMAQNMISAGARNVLLIDEGDDVFQLLADDNGECQYSVMPRRGRLRAVLVFGTPHS